MQVQSLGQQTGMNMVQVPEGVNASEVLRALQDHPGMVPCALCTRERAPVPEDLPGMGLAHVDVHVSLAASLRCERAAV